MHPTNANTHGTLLVRSMLVAIGFTLLCGGCPPLVQSLDGVWAITSPQQQGRACITIADGVIAGIETCRHDVDTPWWLEVYDLHDSTAEVVPAGVRWTCTIERLVSDDAIATELLTLEAQVQPDGTLAGVLTLAGSGPPDSFPVTLTRWVDETDPDAPELTELSYSVDDAEVTFRFREVAPVQQRCPRMSAPRPLGSVSARRSDLRRIRGHVGRLAEMRTSLLHKQDRIFRRDRPLDRLGHFVSDRDARPRVKAPAACDGRTLAPQRLWTQST